MDTTPRDLDALLAQAGWAKALARSLVRDPDRAEDLVQRAWLAALRHPPSGSTPPRRWLATVMRNFARDDARESASRLERERAVARPERGGGSDPVEDAASAQARLLAAVRELPEPSRSTVWARYYDGLAPRDIAARDGVPVETVKTRLARGLESLRKRFDREHGGDRSAWVLAFVPLTAEPHVGAPLVADPLSSGPLVATTITTFVMDAKLKIAAVLALVACGSAVWISTRDGEVAPRGEALAAAVVPELAASGERVEPQAPLEPTGAARAVVEEPRAAEAAPATVAAVYRDGIVLDLDRRPVPGLEIIRGDHEPILVDGRPLVSDAHGRFRLSNWSNGYVTARGRGWVTAFATQDDIADARAELCVIVARQRDVTGTVVDASGAPVENAFVGHHVAESVRRGLGEVMRGPVEIGFEARTDANGRFAIQAVPDTDAMLVARAENRRSGSTSVVTGPVEEAVIVLPAPEAGSITLRGRVVDPAGEGVERATVAIAGASVKSGANGRFELPVLRSALEAAQRTTNDFRPSVGVMPLHLRAIKEDRLPARITLPVLEELERIAASEEFRLELGGAPLSITGRVVDSEGAPVEKAVISLVDEDSFGMVEMEFSGMTLNGHLSVEQFLRGGFAAQPVTSDANGRFAISGLQARDYKLSVVASAIPAARKTDAIGAGRTDVEIALDTSGSRTKLAGRVVDRRGKAIGGVRVEVRSALPGFDGLVEGPSTTADADGKFTFEGVRGQRFQFEVTGKDVMRSKSDVRAGDALDELVVSASRRAFVQVDLGESPPFAADTARFFDSRGESTQFDMARTTVSENNSSSVQWTARTFKLTDGRSEVGATGEGEYVCVLENSGVEVARIPVSLGGEGVTIVRP